MLPVPNNISSRVSRLKHLRNQTATSLPQDDLLRASWTEGIDLMIELTEKGPAHPKVNTALAYFNLERTSNKTNDKKTPIKLRQVAYDFCEALELFVAAVIDWTSVKTEIVEDNDDQYPSVSDPKKEQNGKDGGKSAVVKEEPEENDLLQMHHVQQNVDATYTEYDRAIAEVEDELSLNDASNMSTRINRKRRISQTLEGSSLEEQSVDHPIKTSAAAIPRGRTRKELQPRRGSDVQRYECVYCTRRQFSKWSELLSHQYNCKASQPSTSNFESLSRQIATGEKVDFTAKQMMTPFCPHCKNQDMPFFNKGSLLAHMKKCSGAAKKRRTFYCTNSFCKAIFFHESLLQEHLKTCTPPTVMKKRMQLRFQCPKCKMMKISENSLMFHLKRCSGDGVKPTTSDQLKTKAEKPKSLV
ncbi:hypothetical protein PENTCL1PPCAC_12065, partial [Pristionchus entomophagus]